MCVADVQAMTGSARRTVPCTVNSHPNTTQMFPVPVTARINIEPDANSGETKSVFIASVTCLLYLFVFIISQILWTDFIFSLYWHLHYMPFDILYNILTILTAKFYCTVLQYVVCNFVVVQNINTWSFFVSAVSHCHLVMTYTVDRVAVIKLQVRKCCDVMMILLQMTYMPCTCL